MLVTWSLSHASIAMLELKSGVCTLLNSTEEFKSVHTPDFKWNKKMRPQLLTDLISTVGHCAFVQSLYTESV